MIKTVRGASRSFAFLAKHYDGDHIGDETGGTCETLNVGIPVTNLKGKGRLVDLDVDGRTTLNYILNRQGVRGLD